MGMGIMEQPKLDEKLLYDIREITNASNIHEINNRLGPYQNGPRCFANAKSGAAREGFANSFKRSEIKLRRILSEAKRKKAKGE